MPNGMTALATLTLGSTASTVTFSSIVGTYKDLVLIVEATNSSANTNLRVQYNGDTATNYSYVAMEGYGNSYSSSQNATVDYALSGVNSNTLKSHMRINIMDYSATDKHKTSLIRYNKPDTSYEGIVGVISNRWSSTSAITTILVYPGSSTFASGSTFTLYGVSA
jgi:hypothetical protein